MGMTPRQTEIWNKLTELKITHNEALNALAGMLDGVEQSTGQNILPSMEATLIQLREFRTSESRASEKMVDTEEEVE